MATITSTFEQGPVQSDGRSFVEETHTVEDGRVFKYSWWHTGLYSPEAVLEERKATIMQALAEREAARAAVIGTEVPYTKYEFLERFTQEERKSIRTVAKADDNVEDFMEMLSASGGVYPTLARPGLNYLQSLGILTQARVEAIGAAQ